MRQLTLLCLLSLALSQIHGKQITPARPSTTAEPSEASTAPITREPLQLLYFTASWCGPCRREMPTIQAIIPKFKNSNLKIVLVNTAESEDITFGFIGSIAPDLDTLVDTDGLVTERWQPRGLPSTYFVDPHGKLQYLALGGRNWDEPDYLNFLQNLIKK